METLNEEKDRGVPESTRNCYSRAEAAVYLGLSVVTVDRAIQKGNIGYFRLGRRILFSKDQLNDFLTNHEVKPKARRNWRGQNEL